MPQPRTRFAAAVFNNEIWVIGGYDNVAGSGAHCDQNCWKCERCRGEARPSHQCVVVGAAGLVLRVSGIYLTRSAGRLGWFRVAAPSAAISGSPRNWLKVVQLRSRRPPLANRSLIKA